MSRKFVNLHNHTTCGSFDAVITPESFVKRIQSIGQEHVVQTDHGTMGGMVSLAKAARKAHLHYIPGVEFYLTYEGLLREGDSLGRLYYHLVALAQNKKGLKNLYKLVRISSHPSHRYYKPRIDWNELAENSEGIIITTACVASRTSRLAVAGEEKKLKETLEMHAKAFPGRFYLELQDSGAEPIQGVVNASLQHYAKVLGLPLIATSDAHFAAPEDAPVREAFMRMKMGGIDSDDEFYKAEQLYLKTGDELASMFGDEPIANTLELVKTCEEIDIGVNSTNVFFPLPNVPQEFVNQCSLQDYPESIEPPDPNHSSLDQRSIDAYLEWKAKSELEKLGLSEDPVYQERLQMELETIKELNFASYFLVLEELLAWCREVNIPYGPGRGSAAGSLVCYVLKITGLDPVKYGLFFSRFLNKSRVSWPDIDIDFDKFRRDEVIDHIIEKYGEDRVCQIMTFSNMQPRGMARDIGRMLGDSNLGAEVAGLIPGATHGKEPTVQEAIQAEPKLKASKYQEVIDLMLKLEGLVRSTGQHAAGVIIAPCSLSEIAPVSWVGSEKDMRPVVQLDMNEAENIGLIKMDILGLRNLSVINNAIAQIDDIETMYDIPMGDTATMDYLCNAPTLGGVFQLETSIGMVDLARQLKPKNEEEIAVILALFRPGPIESGMLDKYVKRSLSGWVPTSDPLDQITKDTNGCLVYQEQIIRVCVEIAGFTEVDGDKIRKVLGKKKREEVDKWREPFVEGCVKHSGLDRVTAEQMFSSIESGASYLFNKSHAVAYAFISYWCAYLLTHYQAEYMAALINASSETKPKLLQAINTAKMLDLEVLPPTVLKLSSNTIAFDNEVRLGTSACKFLKRGANALVSAIQPLIDSKQLTLYSFFESINRGKYNSLKAKALSKSGALDVLAFQSNMSRSGLIASIDYIYDYFRTNSKKSEQRVRWLERKAKREEQEKLKAKGKDYGGRMVAVGKEPAMPEFSLNDFTIDKYPDNPLENLQGEFEVLSICLTGNLLDYLNLSKKARLISEITEKAPVGYSAWNKVRAAGIVSGFKISADYKHQTRASFNLEDSTGVVTANISAKMFSKMGTVKIDDGTCIEAEAVAYKTDAGVLRLSVKQFRILEPIAIPEQSIMTLSELRNALAKPTPPDKAKIGRLHLSKVHTGE